MWRRLLRWWRRGRAKDLSVHGLPRPPRFAHLLDGLQRQADIEAARRRASDSMDVDYQRARLAEYRAGRELAARSIDMSKRRVILPTWYDW